MKWLVYGGFGLILLSAAVLAAGYLLPAKRTGGASRVIAATPAELESIIRDVARQAEWRADIASVVITADGWTETTRQGEVIRFAWLPSGNGQLALSFQTARGVSGRWMAVLTPVGDATRITVEETTEIPGPLTRILAYLFFDPAAFAHIYLRDLEARAEAAS